MMTRPCDMLPPVRGSMVLGAPLKDLVWFRAGGPAEMLFRPADADDLAAFLAARPADIRVSVIGVGSNLLVRDGGWAGTVILMHRPSAEIRLEGEQFWADAGAACPKLARHAARECFEGAEFLAGVPGTIGGALDIPNLFD